MRKFGLTISFIFISLFLFIEVKANLSLSYIDVKLTAIFDEDNYEIDVTLEDRVYGSKVSLDSIFNSVQDNSFAFWVVNGVVRTDLPLNHEFVVTSELILQAVFSPDDKNVVLFIDSNGSLLEVKFVDNNSSVEFTGDIPSKPGLVVAPDMWNGSLSNITTDKVFVLQYIAIEDQVFNVNVINGSGSGEYQYNDLVYVNANASTDYFNYWVIDDVIVSYDEEYIFTALSDIVVEAVFSSQRVFKLPSVTLSENLDLPDRVGFMSFKGQFYLPEHYELIEFGMIASNVKTEMVVVNPLVEVKQATSYLEVSNEWLMSFNEDSYSYVRGYLIVKNTQDEFLVVYSYEEEIESYNETFSNFIGSGATYVSETFTGDSGVIWSVTEVRKNLDIYDIDGGGIMIRVPGTITGTIPNGMNYLSLDMKMAFTGGTPANRTIEIYADGGLIGSKTLTTTNQIEKLIINNLSFNDSVNLEIRATGVSGRQITLNNMYWENHNLEEDKYLLQLISDEDVDLSVNVSGPYYSLGDALTVSAGSHNELLFSHWEDVVSGNVLSFSANYSFNISDNLLLRAVYIEDSGETVNVIYSSNIGNQHASIDVEGPYEYNQEVVLTANTVGGYVFLYWQDIVTEHVFSYNNEVIFNVNKVYNLRAVYQVQGTLAYTADFNSVNKTSYAVGYFNEGSVNWLSYQSLVGTSDADYIDGTKSVRLDNGGFVATQTPFYNPSKLSFFFKTYGTEASSTLRLQFSTNALSWHNLVDLDTPLSGSAYFEYDFDLLSLWLTYNIDENTPFYFRFVNLGVGGQTNAKINIDDIKIFTYDSFVGYPLYDYQSNVLSFSFDRELKSVYGLGDTWNPSICIATDLVAGEVSCSVSGSVDTSQRGSYLITYLATDSNGTVAEYRKEVTVLNDVSLLEMNLDGYNNYYSSLNGLYGEELVLAMRQLLWTGLTMPSYEQIKSILEVTDRDPANPSNVIHIYTGLSVSGSWDYRMWDREHVWPNSRLGILRVSESGRNAGSDAHNLRPINASINSSRGHLFFDYPDGTYWYPDQSRVDLRSDIGDVARAAFYMSIMYDWLKLIDDLSDKLNATYHFDNTYFGYLSALIDFHYQDLPDSFEITRNNLIYTYQNNRNPFVDYPHFVELIWFEHDNIPEA